MMPFAALNAKMSLICSPNSWLYTNTTIPQQCNIVSRPQSGSYQYGRRDLTYGFNFRAAQTIDALSILLYINGKAAKATLTTLQVSQFLTTLPITEA